MPKAYKCAECGRKVYKISRRGYCRECSQKKVVEAVIQIRERHGPLFEKWQRNLNARVAARSWKKDPDLED